MLNLVKVFTVLFLSKVVSVAHPLTGRYGFLKNGTVWINSICCLCSIRCVKYCF